MPTKDNSEEQTPPSHGDGHALIHVRELQRNNFLNRMLEEVSNIASYNSLSLHQLEVKLSLLERHLESFEKVQGHLESVDESQFEHNHRSVFENAYFKLKSQLLECLSMHRTNINEPPISSTQFAATTLQQSTKPHLPPLQLTKFSGNYNDWTEFYNMFCILVHDNADLSPISKFQYLRSCLTDNAAKLIQSLDITVENYYNAMEILKSRYDNKRLIFQSHIEKIFAIKDLPRPKVDIVREFIDSVNANLRALQSIASKNQISDGIILHLITSKLDPETQVKWEEEIFLNREKDTSSHSLTLPQWNDLLLFLERRCKSLEIVSKTGLLKPLIAPHGRNINLSQSLKKHKVSSFVTLNKTTTCCFCNTTPNHNAFHCTKFIEMSSNERFRTVKRLKLCINCLGSNHVASTCPSTNRCQQCQGSHHTLLHRDQTQHQLHTTNTQNTTTSSNESDSPVALQVSDDRSEVILGTARVELQAQNGRSIAVRALLDSGSQLHFITEKIAQFLRVNRKRVNIEITGINSKSPGPFSNCSLILKSSQNDFLTPITAVIIPSITSYQPQTLINIEAFNIPSNVKLADKYFHTPGPIDLLIGAGLFYELLMVGQIKNINMPILQKTLLGWIVTGKTIKHKITTKQNQTMTNDSQLALCVTSSGLNSPQSDVKDINQLCTNSKQKKTTADLFTISCIQRSAYASFVESTEPLLENILERFWKIEEPTGDIIHTTEEIECERFFEEYTTRCPVTNKFIVRLPFKQNPSSLGSSVEIATRRFKSLEKRLGANENIAIL